MKCRRTIPIICLLTIFLTLTTAGASAAESGIVIQEIYSDIESCDITVASSITIEDLTLEVQLLQKGRAIDKATIPIDRIETNSNIIKFVQWHTTSTPDGAYQIDAQIFNEKEEICSTEYEFIHGRQIIPDVIFEGIISNSEGVSAVIKPTDTSLADIEYMLVEGNDIIYFTKDEKISIHTNPLTVNKGWNTLLANNKEYTGRVKVRISDPGSIIVATDTFTSMDDAEITDIYKDEIGASATIAGNSQVPFDGYVRFTVYNENSDEIMESAIMRSPILLTEDDETVETIWKKRLTEGRYKLAIEIIGNDGDILDIQETMIDVEKVTVFSNDIPEGTNDGNSTPSFLITTALAAISAGAIVLRRKHF
ncbi:hypothetical protein [Methanococcoides sp.]|uniref:hypothetical protein n=1 Tax=Methanococcoides sp. TaxID=1966350 RepID=UPI00272E89DD|nr:hypothetical protein [Methanococcoides sp.]